MSTPSSGLRTGNPGHIFVSYSRHDLDWVRRLVSDLETAGLPVWLDVRKLEPGAAWDSEIELALRDTDILLVVLSEHSAASRNVLDEINYVLSRNGLVVPVLYRACEVPYRLARLQHLDFTGPYDGAIKSLIEQLHSAESQRSPADNGLPTMAAPATPQPSLATITEVPRQRPAQPQSPAVSARQAAIPAWRRPAVAWSAAAACLLLVSGLGLLRLRNDSAAGRPAAPIQAAAHRPIAATDAAPSAPDRRDHAEPVAPTPPPSVSSEISAGRMPAVPPAVSRSNGERTPAAATAPPVERGANVAPAPVTPLPAPPRTGLPPAMPGATTAALAPVVSVVPPSAARPAGPAPNASSIAPTSAVPGPGAALPAEPVAPVRSAQAVDEDALIRGVVALYARALNEKSISLLTRVRPNLARSDAESLLKGMPAAHTVSFGDIAVKVDEGGASVRLTRRDMVGEKAEPLQTILALTLLRQNDRWVIERIERAR